MCGPGSLDTVIDCKGSRHGMDTFLTNILLRSEMKKKKLQLPRKFREICFPRNRSAICPQLGALGNSAIHLSVLRELNRAEVPE